MSQTSHSRRRTLVTGGAGFLGSHLCDRLIALGDEVVCLDNLYTGSKANISHLMETEGFRFVEHDITTPFQIEVDRIFNLACPASPVHYQYDPIMTVRANVMGAINMLELAKATGARILQASTSEVYGDPEIHPQTESYWGRVNPIGPRACYDEGKRCAETLFFDYSRQENLDIKVARIFNTYGPRMAVNDGRVVSNFVVQALTHQPITIYGDGSQTRSFCFVSDLIGGLLRLMDTPVGFRGPVNLGNPNEFTILQLAEGTIAQTGSRSVIEHRPLPQDDPQQRQPDITLAETALDWRPQVELREGLAQTIDYFSRALKRGSA